MKSNPNTVQPSPSAGRTTEISLSSTGTPTDTRSGSLHEEISARARELWEKQGRPEGRDEEIWLEAEKQVLRPDPRVPGPATSVGSGRKKMPTLA